MPSVYQRHYISGQEIEMLCEIKKEPTREIFQLAVGALMGALMPALQSMTKFNDLHNSMTWVDLIAFAVAIAVVAIAAASWFLWNRRTIAAFIRIKTIRQRTQLPVRRT